MTNTTTAAADAAQTEKIKAEAALIRAQADLIKANAELAAANKPPDPALAASNAEKARLDAAKGALDSAKALADARKAADLSAVQAAIGTVAHSGIEGTVTLKPDAGKGEATLLAARALQEAAAAIAAAVSAAKVKADDRVLLLQGAEMPQFANHRQFLLQTGLLTRAYDEAEKEIAKVIERANSLFRPVGEAVRGEALPAVTVAGAVIDAAAKLGSYFMTNYESGGITLTPDGEQLAAAVAGKLLGKATVILPARRMPLAKDFDDVLQDLAGRVKRADERAGELADAAARVRAQPDAATDPRLQGAANACDDAAAALKKSVGKIEEFITSLGVADAKGVLLITKIAQEKAVVDELGGKKALALLLDVRSTVGSYYTKKNLWTFFGLMPFYVMGGIVVTYYLVDGDGVVKASGLQAIHGGYKSVQEVQTLLASG